MVLKTLLKDLVYEVRANAKKNGNTTLIDWFDSHMRQFYVMFTFYDPALSMNDHNKEKFDSLQKLFLELNEILNHKEKFDANSQDKNIKVVLEKVEEMLKFFTAGARDDKNVDLEPIFDKLRKESYTINDYRLYEKTGLNNFLFYVDAKIMRESGIIPYPMLIKISDKKDNLENETMGLELLNSHKHLEIPVVKIIAKGSIAKHTYVVMQYIESKTLRELKNNVALVKKTAEILAKIHKIKVSHIGNFHDQKKSWFDYVYGIMMNSLNILYEKGHGDKFQKNETIENSKLRMIAELDAYLKSYAYAINDAPMRFVHTDFNFHNVLVSDNVIAGIIDTEFFIGGDPAFEFNAMDLEKDNEPYEHTKEFITEYLKMAKSLDSDFNVHDFLLRHRIYAPIKSLFYAAIFATKRPDLVGMMVKYFQDDFDRAKGPMDKILSWFDKMFSKNYSHI